MKIGKVFPLFLFTLVLVGCSPTALNKPTQTSTVETPSPVLITPLPSITPIPVVTDTPLPAYRVIDEKNVGQLTLLHQWEVDMVFYGSTAFWFSDSTQFIVPVSKASVSGIQSFEVDNFAPTWFAPTGFSKATIVAHDQVITYLHGLHIFNRQGVEIQTLQTNDNCGENIAFHIVAIPGTDLIVTGHWHYGDITNSYGTSRLLVWDKSRNSCTELLEEFVGGLWSLSASYDGRYISYSVITSTPDLVAESTTHVYDMELQKETCHLVGLLAKFNSQNKLAVYNPIEGMISLITPADCTTRIRFNVEIGVLALAFDSSGDLLAGASESIIDIWNVKTGEKLHEIDLQASLINWPLIGFSPDGRFLVTTKSRTSPAEKYKIMLWGIPGN